MVVTALFIVMAQQQISSTPRPPVGENSYYVGNRAPLVPSAFQKLPIGAIKPLGWVRKQLELEADGFTGHLTEISPWLKKDHNAWLSPKGEGENGWEEVPYWLKGFGDLGYLLNDPRIKAEAKVWVDGVLASQGDDGWFGPRANLKSNDGKPDVWPNMVMLNALQTYYEYSGDERVLKFMTAYFHWELAQPDDAFLLSYWEKQRGGDNMESVYWLYNRTGETRLLDLVAKLHRRTADWVGGIPDLHGVNYAQAFREPASNYELSKDPTHLLATYHDFDRYYAQFGLVPGGMYGADENARVGFGDPRQAAETCAMVEMMLSDELLVRETGDPLWADRCEDVAFNSLPASMTPDLKALHYLTAPNMIKADRGSKNPGLQNSGPMLCFDPYDHRCCQHNVSHGWPYLTEHLWMATAGNGLAAVLYGPSEVTAKVGSGSTVTILEETGYPFDETMDFHIKLSKPEKFPLVLRIPGWCDTARIALNKRVQAIDAKAGAYVVIDREWKDGDSVRLRVPMNVRLTRWVANKDAVSVCYGPLTFSLKIGEQYKRSGGTDAWPAWEVVPSTAWNYGIVPDPSSIEVFHRKLGPDAQPFDPKNVPIELSAKARRIPGWQEDYLGLVGTLQQSPARTTEPAETVSLIPMGAARLRISAFPTVTTAADGHVWTPPQKPKTPLPASASHVNGSDTLAALSDGLAPSNSGDLTIPRFTWWDHVGTTEWVQYDLPAAQQLSHAEVYWFDDERTNGGCRIPKSWHVFYDDNGLWKEVSAKGAYSVEKDRFNVVDFAPVQTTRVRIEVQLQENYSGGILEWIVK